MIFAHTLDKVIQGEKWQTRRLVKPGECFEDNKRIIKNGRRMYEVGRSYAVQPNRGQKAVARIRLKGLRKETIDKITESDARAEGFASVGDFLNTWHGIHGFHTDLSSEVWVFEFELISVTEEAVEGHHEGANATN